MRSKNPYSYFSEELALDEAKELPEEFYTCLTKWKKDVLEIYDSNTVSWYSKNVSTSFVYNGKKYRIIAEDLYTDETVDKANKGKIHIGYLHAVVESFQGSIKEDLMKLGASDIKSIGFLD